MIAAPKAAWATRTARPDPGEHLVLAALRELERSCPAFDHTFYNHETLHGALQEYLDMEIRVELLRDDEYALAGRSVRLSPIEAGLLYVEGAEHVTIFLPASTPEAAWADLVYHELWHLAAGHPLPFRRREAQGRPAFWRPSKILCPRVPPYGLAACARDPRLLHLCLAWCEADADAAVAHLGTISALRHIYTGLAPRSNSASMRRLPGPRGDRRSRALKSSLRELQRLSQKFSDLLDVGTNLAPGRHTVRAEVSDLARTLRLDPAAELRAHRGVAAVALLWSAGPDLHGDANRLLTLRRTLDEGLPDNSPARRGFAQDPNYDAIAAALWILGSDSAPSSYQAEPWIAPIIAVVARAFAGGAGPPPPSEWEHREYAFPSARIRGPSTTTVYPRR